MKKAEIEQCHALWDSLAGHSASRIDDALTGLLRGLTSLINAQNSYWMGTLRLSDIATDDPIKGWRPRAVYHLKPSQERLAASKEHFRRIHEGNIDPTVIANLSQIGRFRVTTSHELAPEGWFNSEFYRSLFEPFEIVDTIYVATPLGDDLESWFAFERTGKQQDRFGPSEREILAYAVRPLKWFQYKLILNHGVRLVQNPLKPAERRVLNGLLTNMTEQEIARECGLTQTTVHTYCTRIYRKFNVRGRAGLTALWLGESPTI